MSKNYILIDYENVQPKNIELLKGNNFKILVFVGANQNKIPFEIVEVLQSFGNDAEYIKIDTINKNNLDFHIAFYIGKISSIDENAYFHIISKDTGFDSLINHLKNKKIKIQRQNDLSEIKIIKKTSEIKNEDRKNINIESAIETIIKNIKAKGNSKPTTKKALLNSMDSWLRKNFDEKSREEFVKDLIKKKYISIKDNKITYNF